MQPLKMKSLEFLDVCILAPVRGVAGGQAVDVLDHAKSDHSELVASQGTVSIDRRSIKHFGNSAVFCSECLNVRLDVR